MFAEKEEGPQLELFSQIKKAPAPQRRSTRGLILRLRGHEKAVITAIILIMAAVGVFSLGVERGKTLSRQEGVGQSRMDLAVKTAPLPLLKAEPRRPAAAPSAWNEEQPLAALPKADQSLAKYTVQVASYNAESYAQREAEALKKKGFSAMVLSKGKYAVLCVGSFNSRDEALSFLSKLKKQKRYRDCILRRL